MRENPKISVLIPTYNYARFLPEAIESVLRQSFADFELVVCDDHSTDNTAEVLKKYAGLDSRIRAEIHSQNLGMVQNWNHCLTLARGNYVKFLFGDDKLAQPEALGKLAQMLDSNPRATLAASARKVIDDRSEAVDIWRTFREGRLSGRDVIIKCLMEHANLIGEPSAVLFRKSDVRFAFDTSYRQIVDLDFWFRLLEKGDLIYTREPLVAFRRHLLQQTVRNDSEGGAWKEHLTFAAKWAEESWVPKKALFPIVYEFRRSARKHANMRTPELRAKEQGIADRLGNGSYWLYWMKHRLTRPWQNAAHSIGKRFRRRQSNIG